jgi:hypothetical protein
VKLANFAKVPFPQTERDRASGVGVKRTILRTRPLRIARRMDAAQGSGNDLKHAKSKKAKRPIIKKTKPRVT